MKASKRDIPSVLPEITPSSDNKRQLKREAAASSSYSDSKQPRRSHRANKASGEAAMAIKDVGCRIAANTEVMSSMYHDIVY